MAAELSKNSPPEVSGLAISPQQAVDDLRQELGPQAAREEAASFEAGRTSNQDNHMIDDIKRKINHTKHLVPLPVDFARLAEGGLLVKDGDKYKGSDLNRLPEHVLYRIKFIEQQDNVTDLTLNEKGL